MVLQLILSQLSSWLEAAGARWGISRAKLRISKRWTVFLSLGGLAAGAFLLRCLHLFDAKSYYILSADSYYFHWLAGRVMSGQGAPPNSPPGVLGIFGMYTLHSGLAYPLAHIAKGVSSVLGLSSADALNLVSKSLPPVLGVISMTVLYLAVSRIYDRRLGLLSALAWALAFLAIFYGAAGYLDRDGLNVLLLMTGAFLFYLTKIWHLHIGNRDIGWLLAVLGVLVIEGMLYLEWSIAGPVLLLAIIVVYFVVEFLKQYFDHTKTEPNTLRRPSIALGQTNWRPFAVIVVGHIAAVVFMAALNPGQLAFGFAEIGYLFHSSGAYGSIEMQGIGLGDIIQFQFLLIPMAVGLYAAWKERADRSIFFASWFLVILVSSVFARRWLEFFLPAACVLTAVGLVFLWGWAKQGDFQRLKKVGLVAMLLLQILFSSSMAANVGSSIVVAPDKDWQDALAYLREETPKDSVVMSQWSWGYWILDLGQREPFVDNGFYGWDSERLRDVELAYATSDPLEAARIMQKRGVEYLVLTKFDVDLFAPSILGWAGVNEAKGNNTFAAGSLVVRALNGQFESEGGLKVVHRSFPKGEVVILEMTQPGQP